MKEERCPIGAVGKGGKKRMTIDPEREAFEHLCAIEERCLEEAEALHRLTPNQTFTCTRHFAGEDILLAMRLLRKYYAIVEEGV